MAQWSQDEFNRTVDEVKRRCLIDQEFRLLAIANSTAAIAKINPKPLPAGVKVEFIATSAEPQPAATSGNLTIVIPDIVEKADDLTDAELEQAAGGMTDIKFPPE